MKKRFFRIVFALGFSLSAASASAQRANLLGESAYKPSMENPPLTLGGTSQTLMLEPKAVAYDEQSLVRVLVKESSLYNNSANLQRQKKINSTMSVKEMFIIKGLFKFPQASDTDPPAVGAEINGQNRSNGSVQQKENLVQTVTCKVVSKLENGTLYIEGTRNISVGEESRRIFVGGIIRPQDITQGNSIQSDQIAEFVYKDVPAGMVFDSVRRSYGTRWMDHWMPF